MIEYILICDITRAIISQTFKAANSITIKQNINAKY